MADSGYPIGIISIHALHEESDPNPPSIKVGASEFQSTLSMRRATFVGEKQCQTILISIHALHEESDKTHEDANTSQHKFQSTLSMRRATAPSIFFRKKSPYFNPRSP